VYFRHVWKEKLNDGRQPYQEI